MVPGLWLEPECVGVNSPTATELPDSAFVQRNGRRVTEWGRHQLDLSDETARAFLDETIDGLVQRYGLGYLKFDYNIDGLIGQNRAYLTWLDALLFRHPQLTIENCAAGGSRTDQSLLSRLPIQSLTDQQDHRLMPPIAAAAPLAVPPEQGAVWAYPQPDFSDAENAFTLATALLSRIHLSGRIDLLNEDQRALVRRAIEVYKSYRHVLATAVPHWPLGLPGWDDTIICQALETADGDWYVLVWRREEVVGGVRRVEVPLTVVGSHDQPVSIDVLFAADHTQPAPTAQNGVLTVAMRPLDAVLLRIRPPRSRS